MVSSYVDDGAILVATDSIEKTMATMEEYYNDCSKVAKGRGMAFSWSKSDWIGLGSSKKWGKLKLGKGGEEKDMVEEMRILGYRLDRKMTMREHMN